MCNPVYVMCKKSAFSLLQVYIKHQKHQRAGLNENANLAPQGLPVQMPDAGGQMPENVFNPLFSVLCFLASDLCFGR
jgi:hypothetical protein